MDEQKALLEAKLLIALLRDGERGFRLLSEQVHHPECRAFLWEESHLRGIYAAELEHSLGKIDGTVHVTGTKLGALHRRWTAVKATLGASDYALLEATELCEWFAVKTYDEVLREGTMPDGVRELIAEQARNVHRSQAIMQEFRKITRE